MSGGSQGFGRLLSPKRMSDSTSAELAARTVYRNKEGKKVTRAELLAERAREKRVKASSL